VSSVDKVVAKVRTRVLEYCLHSSIFYQHSIPQHTVPIYDIHKNIIFNQICQYLSTYYYSGY
jgi:hypothetical protein